MSEMGHAQVPTEPRARFVYDFGWGDLQHHWQDCDDCGATGLEEADGSGPPDECPSCDGNGRNRWGSFYEQDIGECAFCDAKQVRIAEMYEGGGCYGEGWVCLPCYVQHHREAHPGCTLWSEAEAALDALPTEDTQRTETASTKEGT